MTSGMVIESHSSSTKPFHTSDGSKVPWILKVIFT